jgi:hypothetical protein
MQLNPVFNQKFSVEDDEFKLEGNRMFARRLIYLQVVNILSDLRISSNELKLPLAPLID